jgi:polysaccharide biosynthesis protein PslG
VLDQAAQSGIGWIRVDFDWISMEPARGQFNWAPWDRVVRGARARNLQVYATLAYTPGWANGGQDRAVPPTNPQDWYDFVHTVVTRYRGQVGHWGLWNEPNLDHFYRGSRDYYVDTILRLGHQAVKDADPASLTCGPDLAHLNSGDWDGWLDYVLRRGGNYFDVITHHIYSDPGRALRRLDGWTWFWEPPNVRKVIQRAGQANKPFWLTETGYRSDERGAARQARDLRELLEGLERRSWIDRVFIYEVADDPNWNQKWGILEANANPKPAFYALRDFVAGLAPQPPAPPTQPPAPPQPGRTWVWEAEDLNHREGVRESDGWACHTPQHAPNYMVFGPYTRDIPAGTHTATWRLMLDNVTASDSRVLTLDVFDADANRVLASRHLTRRQFSVPFQYQDFGLRFSNSAGHRIELRTYWHDTSYVKQDRVTVTEGTP